jgi:hypothetical protein
MIAVTSNLFLLSVDLSMNFATGFECRTPGVGRAGSLFSILSACENSEAAPQGCVLEFRERR